MSKQKRIIFLICVVFSILFFIIIYLYTNTNKSDPELNLSFSPIRGGIYNYHYNPNINDQYYWYYQDKFNNLPIDITFPISLKLDWLIIKYDEVYTGKEDYFYIWGWDDSNDLLKLYNNNPESYYYLKPYLDCYLLMDRNKKPYKKELETIKEAILYALEYYINGKDFVGSLE